MTAILAVDPGPTESAYVLLDPRTYEVEHFGKIPNDDMRVIVSNHRAQQTAIEMVASYGMPVGAEVFETVYWIGRFCEIAPAAERVFRKDVTLHHCHSPRANDATITQALLDRFAPGVRNHGKGVKDAPGFFYGFRKDVWQAMALAVYVADRDKAVAS